MFCIYTWNGATNGLWQDPSNWSAPNGPGIPGLYPPGPPYTGTIAEINSGSVLVNAATPNLLCLTGIYLGTQGNSATLNITGGHFKPTSILVGNEYPYLSPPNPDVYTINLSGGILDVTWDSFYGSGTAGTVIINQTGGVFVTGYWHGYDGYINDDGMPGLGGVNLGFELVNGGKVIYNMAGGEFANARYVVMGSSSIDDGRHADTMVQWNISGGKVTLGILSMGHPDYFSNGNTNITGAVTRNEMNITGGKIIADEVYFTTEANTINITGSKAEIRFNSLLTYDFGRPCALEINSLIDSHGASTINCNFVDMGASPPVDIKMPAFISVKVDHVDIPAPL